MNTKIASTFGLDVHGSVSEIILSRATHSIAEVARANLNLLKNPGAPDRFILSAKSEVDVKPGFGGLTEKILFIAQEKNPKKAVPMIASWCDATFSKSVTKALNDLANFIKDLTPENIKSYEKEILSLKE